MTGFSYLLNRRGHYYFRIAIPHALAPRFNARELIYSLKTKNLGEAKLRCRSMHQAALWFFRGIEGMPRITPEEAKKIAQSYFKECLDRLAVQVVTVDLYSDSLMKVLNQRPDIPTVAGEGVTDDLRRLDFLLPDNFDYKNKDDPAEVTGMTLGFRNAFDGDTGRIVDYLRGKHEIEVEKGSLSYKTLEKAVGRAIGELLRIHQAKTNLEADIPVVDEWFKDSSPKITAIAPPEDETPLVSVAKNLFLEESRKAEEAERTLRRKDTAISFWIEVMGDVPMGSITKKGARTYKETLAKLPANMKKRYPDKTVKEVVALSIPASHLMKPQTINDYLGKMQSFIKWAQNNGYYPDTSNPFAGMSLKDRTKKKKKRESFSDDQLKALFSTPVHTGCQGVKQTERYQTGEVLVKDAIYWLPLIALHTGARMGEICQLYVSDLKKIGGVWVFDFNDEGDDKSLKTEASRRKVPVHSNLIKLGILDYQSEIKKNKHERLFPDIPLSSDGTYTNAFSKKFSNFLKVFNIKTDKTSFHSFRHTVKDAFMTGTNVPEELRRAIMGHEKGDVHAAYGSAEMPIKKMKDAIDKLKYPIITALLKRQGQ